MAMQQTEYTAYDLTDENIRLCADKINSGEIVVFPTETVYGIGASCMNEKAIKQIYEIKKRPSSNPLIMHILNIRGAKLYMDLNSSEEQIVTRLTDKFWPGPLTILVKKSHYVPDIVSSETEWVSLRSPSNTIARKLLEYSMVPIVAPSANMSGKITSTYKDHIVKYFKNSNINLLLDNEPTSLGVESTIVKIENDTVSIVRPGIITKEDIICCLTTSSDDICINSNVIQCEVSEQSEHPGSNISHYAPSKKTLMFNFIDSNFAEEADVDESITASLSKSIDYYLTKCACVDYNAKNFHCRDKFGAYVDLSKEGNLLEALFNLYNVLHQLEDAPIENILIFDYWSNKEGLYNTMFDRVIRSSNGKQIMIPVS